ncbi:MAG: flagellar export chaperone FliS [Deltaproteobacteria bacterium]|nr:flagellar export chaperone FliS [Deltaproteobacteria bacterium]
MYARAAGSYKKVSLDSATPERILDEVFVRFSRDCSQARTCIENNDQVTGRSHLAHALELLWALRGALDYKTAPDVCNNLARLYQYARERLLEATVKMKIEPILEAESILAGIQSGFAEARVRSA